MGGHVTVSIDTLRLVADADAATLERLGPQLRLAVDLLARRLMAAPFQRGDDPLRLVRETLDAGTFGVDELLGPAGAERLADRLYAALIGDR